MIESQILYRLLLFLLRMLYIFEDVYQTLMPDWEELMAAIEYTEWLQNTSYELYFCQS